MNWKKILLITCWAVLISMIGAAVGYTILGPHVPLPYQYVEEQNSHKDSNEHSKDELSSTNESMSNEESPDHSSTTPETPSVEKEISESKDVPANTDTDVTSSSHEDESTTEDNDNKTEDEPNEAESAAPKETAELKETENHDSGTEAPQDNESSDVSTTVQSSEQDGQDHSDKPETMAPKEEEKETASPVESTPSATEPEVAAIDPSPFPKNPPVFSTEPSWKLYGQKVPAAEGRPRIAIVLTGLGLSRAATEAAIRQLPSAITLSFTPYARNLESWIALARSHNHEVMLDLPMEPLTYPSDDPGPQALLTGRQPEGNLNNLAWIANRGSGYVGMSAYMGSRFVTSERQMRPVMEYFKDHGLLFLDNGNNDASLVSSLGKSLGTPVVVNQRAIDQAQLSRDAIDARLVQVERIAAKNGFAIATGRPFPVTLERIAKWVSTVEQEGYQLVPITAVIDESSLAPSPEIPSSTAPNSSTIESN
ncbi:divergent polysaccharide deacetylase family protein [Kiloniella sp. EL199]|uniref:divergent polysaccharide deacetylase family protein n=1 Tax=Kiloniella sp. EL199 TaxID=2107581 RepID=UPI000EA3D2A0|nr:divergent polysaccharide deacetylase family protein [Kiloniella sp. EL199]